MTIEESIRIILTSAATDTEKVRLLSEVMCIPEKPFLVHQTFRGKPLISATDLLLNAGKPAGHQSWHGLKHDIQEIDLFYEVTGPESTLVGVQVGKIKFGRTS